MQQLQLSIMNRFALGTGRGGKARTLLLPPLISVSSGWRLVLLAAAYFASAAFRRSSTRLVQKEDGTTQFRHDVLRRWTEYRGIFDLWYTLLPESTESLNQSKPLVLFLYHNIFWFCVGTGNFFAVSARHMYQYQKRHLEHASDDNNQIG